LGSTEVTTKCLLAYHEFYPGDPIPIKIACDNRASKYAVRNFKFKLYRTIRHKNIITGKMESTETNIKVVKEKGCEAGVMFEKDYEYLIPATLEDISKDSTELVRRSSMIEYSTL